MASPLITGAASATNDNSVGTLAWGDVANITAQDNNEVYATSTVGGDTTNRLRIAFTVSSLPDGATITGIRVRTQFCPYGAFSRTVTDTAVQLLIGDVLAGTNKGGANAPVSALVETYTTYTYGGNGDFWGLDETPGTLTVAALKAATNLLALQYTISSGGGTTYALIDYVDLTVYYTEGTAARVGHHLRMMMEDS